MPDIYFLQRFRAGQQRFFAIAFFTVAVTAIFLFVPTVPSFSAVTSRSRAQAVTLARSGALPQAVSMLETLHQQDPENTKITGDLIIIYGWNQQYSEACQLFEQTENHSWPEYVLTAVISSYRAVKQSAKALALAERLLQDQPDSVKLLLQTGMLLVDVKRFEPAEVILDTIETTVGKTTGYYRLSGYLHSGKKQWLSALADYQHLLTLLPDDQSALRQQFAALQQSRSEETAKAILTSHEAVFTDHDREKLLINQAAEKLRWSSSASSSFAETRLLAMQALAMQIQSLEFINGTTKKTVWPDYLLRDVTISLRNLRQMDNVEAVYRYLSEKEEQPDFVKHAAAAAMLANQHPDKSGELYQQILDREPNSFQANIGLYYSFIEQENFADAYQLIDQLLKKEPMYLTYNNPKYRSNNERYLDLDVYTILVRFYGDQLQDAWSRIDELIRNAPGNNWLHEVRGQISNAREWFRQGLYDFHYAGLLNPESLNARSGEISSRISLRQYKEARPMLATMQQQFPEEYPTKRLAREWQFSRKPQYWEDVVFANSSGPELDGDSITATAEMLSAPIYDNLYLDASYRYAWAEIIEGKETFHRYAAGPDYHLMDWDFQARVTYNDSSLDGVGGSINAVWTPNDYWHISLGGEYFSVDTPLRALHHGIRSDSVTAAANYRWSEQRELSVGVQASTFTDNNDRLAGTAVFRQRLLDIPHIDLDGRIELYGSTNSRRDTPYFNPEQDFSLLGALHLDHVYFRYYDHILVQMIDVAYGVYEQKGYGSRWIGHIRYEQRYKFTPWVEMLAGVEYGQNVYDGEAEPYKLIRFMITGKF